MTIVYHYLALAPDLLGMAQKSVGLTRRLMQSKGIDWALGVRERIDLDKAWDGICYLLSAERRANEELAEPTDLLARAVLGGQLLHEELRHVGEPRFLTREEVVQVGGAVAALGPAHLRPHFNVDAMIEADVYPGDWDRIGVDYLLRHFDKWRTFYVRAAFSAAVLHWRS
jgi:Domain of unknown function (DUF1877)